MDLAMSWSLPPVFGDAPAYKYIAPSAKSGAIHKPVAIEVSVRSNLLEYIQLWFTDSEEHLWIISFRRWRRVF